MSDDDPRGLDVAFAVAHAAASRKGPPPKPRRKRPVVETVTYSTARSDSRDPKPVGAALTNLIAQRGWHKQLGLRQMLARWPAIVGEVNAEHSTPESFHDGVLTVRTDSTSWATALRLFAPTLVATLNEGVGNGTVTKVVVVGPKAPSWNHGSRTVRDGRGPRDTYG